MKNFWFREPACLTGLGKIQLLGQSCELATHEVIG